MPEERYMLLPNFFTQVKMTVLNFLPDRWSQKMIARFVTWWLSAS